MKQVIQFCLAVVIGTTFSFGQGENLFKSKCSTCHIIGKKSTGPDLQGVKAKWEAAGEGKLLYQWVKGSSALIASGKSKQAGAIQGYSPTSMPDQQVNDEEIDQIFSYIDTYQPPTANNGTTVGDSTTVTGELAPIKPNYRKNQTMFYMLLIGMGALLLAIALLAGAISSLIKSDIFREKLSQQKKNKDTLTTIVFLIGAGLLIPFHGSAADPAATSEGPEPYLHIENSVIWALVIIDLVLLGMVMYFRWLFNSFYYLAFPKKKKAPKKRLEKAAAALTAAVPVEQESKILLAHEYDGIQELDNRLPPWWLWGFYLSIVFAIAYLFHYHLLDTGDSQEEAYVKEMTQAEKEINAYLKSQAMNVDETNATELTDASALETGKVVFEQNCTVCHKDGRGDIGPNLTDDYWLYGNDIKEVFKTIKNGTPNGMPDHASKLNPIQIQQVASYVLSLKFTPGLPPQGKKMSK